MSPRHSSAAVMWEAWQASVLAFMDAGRFDDAALTIERALNDGQDAAAGRAWTAAQDAPGRERADAR